MKIPFYKVDAFTGKAFSGNPAAVCMLDKWLRDDLLQNIAAENNLSETAFLVFKSKGQYELRWFTPKVEIDLCGHATLASAYVIFSFIDTSLSSASFQTASGPLIVKRSKDLMIMDFPARKPVPTQASAIISQALGAEPIEVLKSRDLLAVFTNEDIIRNMAPNFEKLKVIKDTFAVIVTAPGKKSDFVCRFFAPNAGINEDPVTGSAHSTLVPYWANRLKKSSLHSLQLSKRGGELFCENSSERVKISGSAVLFAKGEIIV